MKSSFYLPMIVYVLAIIPAFMIATYYGGAFGGVVAGIIVAVHPAVLTRTTAGVTDTDVYQDFLPALGDMALSRIIQEKNTKSQSSNERARWHSPWILQSWMERMVAHIPSSNTCQLHSDPRAAIQQQTGESHQSHKRLETDQSHTDDRGDIRDIHGDICHMAAKPTVLPGIYNRANRIPDAETGGQRQLMA